MFASLARLPGASARSALVGMRSSQSSSLRICARPMIGTSYSAAIAFAIVPN